MSHVTEEIAKNEQNLQQRSLVTSDLVLCGITDSGHRYDFRNVFRDSVMS